MTIETLFGPEEIPSKTRSIRFKVIKPVFETLVIKEEISNYLPRCTRFTSPELIFDMFRFLQRETKEHFLTLHLDVKNRIVCIDQVSTGSLTQAVVHPREVFKSSLLSSAAALILIHNHPGGDPTPSREDLEITRRLREAGEILGIKILDHIIIGDSYLSFVSQGLM